MLSAPITPRVLPPPAPTLALPSISQTGPAPSPFLPRLLSAIFSTAPSSPANRLVPNHTSRYRMDRYTFDGHLSLVPGSYRGPHSRDYVQAVKDRREPAWRAFHLAQTRQPLRDRVAGQPCRW